MEQLLFGFIRLSIESTYNLHIPCDIKHICHTYCGLFRFIMEDKKKHTNQIRDAIIEKAHEIANNSSDINIYQCNVLTIGYIKQCESIYDEIHLTNTIKSLCQALLGSMLFIIADKSNKLQSVLAEETKQEMEELDERTKAAEAEFVDARPAMERAQSAVSRINKKRFCHLRCYGGGGARVCCSYAVPLFAVCEILSVKTGKIKTWRDVQKMSGRSDFLKKVLRFNADKISSKMRHYINKKYLSNEDFTFERINKSCKASSPFVLWIKAYVKFSHLLESVEPITKEIKELKGILERKQKQLCIITDLNEVINAKIDNSMTKQS
eukprot:294838_1